jgi:predicted transcriptional regulator
VKTVNIGVRVNEDLVERLDRSGGALDCDRSWLLRRAVIRYLESEEARIIEQRLTDVQGDTATLIPHDELDAWMKNRRTNG